MLHALKAEAQAKGKEELLRRVAENLKRLEIIRGNGYHPHAFKAG
jgi:hypothetical protein